MGLRHQMTFTSSLYGPVELLVVLEGFDGNIGFGMYGGYGVTGEDYALSLGEYIPVVNASDIHDIGNKIVSLLPI